MEMGKAQPYYCFKVLKIVFLLLPTPSWGKQGVEFLTLFKYFGIDNFRRTVTFLTLLHAAFDFLSYSKSHLQTGYTWHAKTRENTAQKALYDVLHCKSDSLSVFKPVKCRGNLNNNLVMGTGGCSTCWMFILLLTAYTFILQYMKRHSTRKNIRC